MKKPYILEEDVFEYYTLFHEGPCIPVAIILHQKGYGDIITGLVRTINKQNNIDVIFCHTWISTSDGEKIDLSRDVQKNVWDSWEYLNGQEANYIDKSKISTKEKLDYWRKRIKKTAEVKKY